MNMDTPIFKINKKKNALSGGVSFKVLTHGDPCNAEIVFISI